MYYAMVIHRIRFRNLHKEKNYYTEPWPCHVDGDLSSHVTQQKYRLNIYIVPFAEKMSEQ